jgi:hypothetical protein
MGHQIIRQPDGKLAIFSTGVDVWIVMDSTADEIADYYARKAAESARESAARTVQAVLAGRPREVYAQFAMTFEEANAESREHDGEWWADGEWHKADAREGSPS